MYESPLNSFLKEKTKLNKCSCISRYKANPVQINA